MEQKKFKPINATIALYLKDKILIGHKEIPNLDHFTQLVSIMGSKMLEEFKSISTSLMEKVTNPIVSSRLIGIEIEAEGINTGWHPVISHSGFWRWHGDSSLKDNGVEFISTPIQVKDSKKALVYLWSCIRAMNGGTEKFGWRSSVHIHLDMTKKKSDHVLKLLLLYLIFEESLFLFCNHKRKNSIFCVPLTRTILSSAVSSYINSKINFQSLLNQWEKYSALNLCPILRQGTVEFRQMEGTKDVSRIMNWINLIVKLDEYAEKTTINEIYDHAIRLNTESYYQAFKETVFGEDINQLLQDTDQSRHMSDGVKFVKECFALNDGIEEKTMFDSAYYQYLKERQGGIEKKKERPNKPSNQSLDTLAALLQAGSIHPNQEWINNLDQLANAVPIESENEDNNE